MRRALVTTSATAAGVVLLLSLKPHAGAVSTAGAKVISSDPSAAASEPSAAPSAAPSATASGSASGNSAGGSTRTVTGDTVDTRYGPVQVRVALNGKTITRVDVLQYPTQDRRDQEINSYALPQLNQEAISAQSAQIDAVSGATYTSDGYTRSLQSALDKAGA